MATNHIILGPWRAIRVRSFISFVTSTNLFQEFKIILIFGRPPEGDSGLDDYDESQYDACSRKGLVVGLLLSIWTGARERFESWACGIILPYHRIKRGERLNVFVDSQMQTWICLIRWWKVEVHKWVNNMNQEIFAYLKYLRRNLSLHVYQLGIIISTADWNRQICFDNIASLLGSPICHLTSAVVCSSYNFVINVYTDLAFTQSLNQMARAYISSFHINICTRRMRCGWRKT